MTPKNEVSTRFVQCVGIDMAKEKFDACLVMSDGPDYIQKSEVKQFKNNKTGFNQLVKWAHKECLKTQPCRFLMEPTGVYHENLAYHLHNLHKPVFIVLGNKVKAFARYKGQRSKTDSIDCQLLGEMGCTLSKDKAWTPPTSIYRELRALCRYRKALGQSAIEFRNQMEAIDHSAYQSDTIVKSIKAFMVKLEKETQKIEKAIDTKIKSDAELKQKVDKLLTIKGVGITTIVTILAETNGFELIKNRKQLAKYAGLDVVANQSGTTARREHISKKGNYRLRGCLYMPALQAIRSNPILAEDYNRLVSKHPESRKVAVTAIMRKILLLVFSLWQNGETWDPDYEKKKRPVKTDLAR